MNQATLWTIVNRNEYDTNGAQLSVPALDGAHYFDLYHGVEIDPDLTREGKCGSTFISNRGAWFWRRALNCRAAGCVYLQSMAKMKEMTAKPLISYSKERTILLQHIVEVKPTKPGASSSSEMVHIPGGDFLFAVRGIEIEGSDDQGVDVQYPWEGTPRRFHEHSMHIDAFDIDKYPVTNKEFKTFLDASHYHPKDDLNFLKDWQGGSYPQGWENKPVTWVSLEDARAYAAWAGKRLPHEWEWQYAAQGTDRRKYPWGNHWKADAVPLPDQDRTLRGPDEVGAHPAGASSLGVMDLVGNVWQWTDEYVDEHTRCSSSTRRKLLSASRVDVVFPASLPE